MFDVDLLSSVPTKSDKGCSKHGESYPCSYMPYMVVVNHTKKNYFNWALSG